MCSTPVMPITAPPRVPSHLLTTDQAAALAGTTPTRVRRLIREGRLPAIRYPQGDGRRWYIEPVHAHALARAYAAGEVAA